MAIDISVKDRRALEKAYDLITNTEYYQYFDEDPDARIEVVAFQLDQVLLGEGDYIS